MTAKLSIGVDPDLRCINMAVLEGRTPVALFVRHNIGGTGDKAIIGAAKCITRIIHQDFVKLISDLYEPRCDLDINLTVESQNMQQAVAYRGKGRKVDYQDILHTGQLAGIWLGAFGMSINNMNLVQPSVWKGQVPKSIHHGRIYNRLLWKPCTGGNSFTGSGGIYPADYSELSKYSYDKINPGDFVDINDSLGLALWGLEK